MTSPSAVESIYFAALEKGSSEERAAYLDGACGGDPDLRRQVERLLKAQPNVGSFLQGPAGDALGTVDEPPVTEQPGTVIGPYRLLEQIGEGGMGLVFVAEQDKPLRRRVALKVIKPGMDTREVVARFEAERQALALMDHPNIAKVLDAGATDAGRPFFVMELVRGVPITKFCDENRLTPRERLELFVPVCAAVQHAHQKGIIHRDLKPSNVLVTLHDGRPVPKVIDFGVAKAVGQRLTERTVYTRFLQMVGTPLYMSPEQAEMSGLDIDTRSDIYSLGVLLYELLTGTTPFDKQRLRTAAFDEVRRIIREEEPPKPSTRVSKLGETLTAISSRRKTEPAKLSRLMRGELDWIVMKALDKDRNRRYETANGLARDLQRYLADEPVEACPPSATYRLRKFARKHRAGLITAAAFAALLLLGGVVSAWQAVRAMQARDAEAAERHAAEEQRDRAVKAERQALSEEQKAKQSAAEARAVLTFFQDKVLAAARPEGQEGGLGREATIRAAVEAAAPGIGAAFADQPAVEAAVRTTLGTTYRYLGEPALAVQQHERSRALRLQALGPDHADTLRSMSELAVVYRLAGRLPEAVALHEETLKRQCATLGPAHPDTLTSMNDLALAYHAVGRRPEAIALHEETVKQRRATLGPAHPDTLTSMNDLASEFTDAGRWPEAIALHEETLKLRRAKLKPDHPDTLQSMNDLATAYQFVGRLPEAVALFEEAYKLQKAKLGPDHSNTFQSMHNLAGVYSDVGRLPEAVALFEEAYKLQQAKNGPDHPDTLWARNGLAGVYGDFGRFAESLALFEENLKRAKAKLGADHPFTLHTMRDFATVCYDRGDYARAEALLLDIIALGKPKHGADNPDVSSALPWLGLTYLKQKRFVEAEPILRECLAFRQQTVPDSWQYFNAQSLLGGSLLGQAKYAAAEPLLVQGYEGMKQREAKMPAGLRGRLTDALERLVQLYDATGRPEKAAEYRAKLPPKDAK